MGRRINLASAPATNEWMLVHRHSCPDSFPYDHHQSVFGVDSQHSPLQRLDTESFWIFQLISLSLSENDFRDVEHHNLQFTITNHFKTNMKGNKKWEKRTLFTILVFSFLVHSARQFVGEFFNFEIHEWLNGSSIGRFTCSTSIFTSFSACRMSTKTLRPEYWNFDSFVCAQVFPIIKHCVTLSLSLSERGVFSVLFLCSVKLWHPFASSNWSILIFRRFHKFTKIDQKVLSNCRHRYRPPTTTTKKVRKIVLSDSHLRSLREHSTRHRSRNVQR